MLLSKTRSRVGFQTPPGASLDLDFRTFRALVKNERRPIPDVMSFNRTSSARCIGPGGVIKNYAANVPRMVYNAAGAPRGLLIEANASNLLKYSNDFSNAVWTKSTGASASFGVLGPDGKMSASRLTDAQATGETAATFYQAVTILNDGLAHCFSIYVRPGTIKQIKLDTAFADGTAKYGNATFDLELGVLVNTSGDVAARIERAPFGYFRISVWMFNNSTGNTTYYCTVYRGAGNDAPGNFDIWCAQAENSDAPSSPIQTEASAGNRAVDLASISLVGADWFNPTEGTFYVDAEIDGGLGNDQTFFTANLGFNDYIWGRRAAPASINAVVSVGGVGQASLVMYGADVSPARYRLAIRYRANDFAAACAGGGALYSDLPGSNFGVQVDTSGSVPSGLNKLWLGIFENYGPLSGALGRLIYFPKILDNDELSGLVA